MNARFLDFAAVREGRRTLADLAAGLGVADLAAATSASLDALLGHIGGLTDAQVCFVAADPHAPDGVGWNVAHVVAHTTATAEEAALVSTILARGVDYGLDPRLRVEVDWRALTTTAACVARIEESRRMRLASLSAWPDHPRLDARWRLPERLLERFGPVDAATAVLSGLFHDALHEEQLRAIIAEALAPA